MSQTHLDSTPKSTGSYDERLCSACMSHRYLCGIRPCPLLTRAKAIANIEDSVHGLSLAGASPPSVFVGERGYPKVLTGPLIPPVFSDESHLMERPDLWLERTLDDLLRLRFSLVRTKRPIPVDSAKDPPRLLHETQTLALSDSPTSSEATLIKRPKFTSVFSGRTLPIGPSAPLDAFRLEDNPKVSKPVDKITSDTDLRATPGVMELFDEGVRQTHLTRLLSVGLLGVKRDRRLVPTKWSITAVDDIVGRQLHKEVLRQEWLNDYLVYFDYALGNTVVLLFIPTGWQFEALECWLGGLRPPIITDREWFKGRKDYAKSVAGAYYATRLPALEHLRKMSKQGGCIVFMEIDPQRWIPLGVWRFREIAYRALQKRGRKYSTLDEAVQFISTKLRTPIDRWLEASHIYDEFQSQTLITDYF